MNAARSAIRATLAAASGGAYPFSHALETHTQSPRIPQALLSSDMGGFAGGRAVSPALPAGSEAGGSAPATAAQAGNDYERLLALVDEATRAWRASLSPRHTGRPPRWRWEDHREWIGVVLRRLSRTNAADGELSMTEAVWSSLSHPLTPPGLADALRQHKTRFSYPPSLRAILRFVATRIASHARGADRADLTDGLTGRGFLRRHWREERRLRAGEQLSFDDGSINLVCWVDWPWGGAGKVSERWGCIVGRFQFLLSECAGTGFLPGYSFVARPLGSYRAEDALGVIARMARHQVRADRHVLEKATWASHAVREFHEATGIEAVHTYSPKHKLVETAFGRLWGRMAPDERLSLGRFRGDDEAGTALWTKLRAGTVDPRKHCQSLAEVVALLDRVIGRANTEPMTSKVYGSWVPAERWAQDLRDHPRPRLSEDLWWSWAPVRRELVVRAGGVECQCPDVLGESWLYRFSWPTAQLYNGKRVRLAFDPLDERGRAAVVLLENNPGTFEKAGAVLTTTAEAVCKVPALLRGRVDWDGGEMDRTRSIRAAQRAARQWVFRAFAADGRTVHTAEAELRGPTGDIAAATMATRRDGATPTSPDRGAAPAGVVNRSARILTDDEEAAELARLAARERALSGQAFV